MDIKKLDIVLYKKKNNKIQKVKIIDIHYDDEEPYYSILLENGKEKQTILKYLYKPNKKKKKKSNSI
jgi:hypothetical protein